MGLGYNIFFTSDTHFSHDNMCTFVGYDGKRIRPFNNSKECDERMIQNWNSIVRPQDKVYFLGDLAFNRNEADKIMPRLNGKKCLIRGNHDNFKLNWYSLWFYDIRGCHNLDSYLLTHIPVHPDSKSRFKRNIHGHLHREIVYKSNKKGEITKIPDNWYRNVCMDANNYFPVPFEEIQKETESLITKGEIIIPKKDKINT